MISFIIIGRNEGWKLIKCLESVQRTIKFNDLKNYEILYIDSDSQDESILETKKISGIKTFKIIDKYNSAVARNIGAIEAKGSVLFFIDGDMEIVPEFLHKVYREDKGLCYNFISGQYINRYYNNNEDYKYDKPYDNSILKSR